MTRIRAIQPITRLVMVLAIALAMSGIAIAMSDGIVAQFPGSFSR